MIPLVSESKCESEVLFVFAVIETGGKQYKVQEGDIIFVEKLEGAEGESVTISKVIALQNDSGLTVGSPYISGAEVTANLVKTDKAKKIYIMKYKSKKNYKKKIGHRQPYTKLQIQSIKA